MNIKELIYFVTVIETGNFTDAADICCVTQPTLSAGIKKLEETLDTALIVRGTKNTGGIRPTPTGAKILSIAKIIQAEAVKIKKIAKNAQNPFAGDLRIGAFPTLCPYFMPQILPLLKEQFSEMRFFVTEEKTENLITMLERDMLDIAFIASPLDSRLAVENYQFLELFFDPFFLAVSSKHELAQRKNFEISVEELVKQDLLLLEEGHCLRTQALEFCNSPQMNNQQSDFRATSLETLMEMVRIGTGTTLVPEIAMKQNRRDIDYIPLEDKNIGRHINAVFNKKIMDTGIMTITHDLLANHHFKK